MKLTSDNETLAENKILILYILDKINKPITNSGLYKLILSIEDLNYFYFQQFLLDLMENKYIINYEKETDFVYEITTDGRNALTLTFDLLPGIIKLKADNTLKQSLKDLKEEVSISAEYIPQNEKEYMVKCRIVENGTTIFEVQTFAGSNEQAKSISNNWNKNATNIYPKILEILTNEKN